MVSEIEEDWKIRIDSHLRSYKKYMSSLVNTIESIRDYNTRVIEFVEATRKTARLVLTKFPSLLQEKSEKVTTNWYDSGAILEAIQCQRKLYQTPPDIFSSDEPEHDDNDDIFVKSMFPFLEKSNFSTSDNKEVKITHVAQIENDIVRSLFLGELRLAVMKHKDHTRNLGDSYRYGFLDGFNNILQDIITTINQHEELKGECDFEKRKRSLTQLKWDNERALRDLTTKLNQEWRKKRRKQEREMANHA